MKNSLLKFAYIATLLLLFLVVPQSLMATPLLTSGQSETTTTVIADGKAKIVEWKVDRVGENLLVEYKVEIASDAVNRRHIMVFAPVVTTYRNSYSLPPIVVRGSGVGSTIKRHNWTSKQTFHYDQATYATNGESLALSATIPFAEWMENIDLVFESVIGGCTKYERLPMAVVAEGLFSREWRLPRDRRFLMEEMELVERAAYQKLERQLIAAEHKLAEAKRREVAEERRLECERGLSVYFRVGSSKIDMDFRDNRAALNEIVESCGKGEVVGRVVVAGFASPDGGLEINRRLGEARAVALREYIVANSSLKSEQIMVLNGSVDWSTLYYTLDGESKPLRTLLDDYYPDLRRAIFKIINF